jgi:AraC-like DNA-binding protein
VIEGSLDQPLTLEAIAKEAALSPYHLHRSFRRLFRESPHEYWTRRRVERAAALLRSSDMPVTEICFACGFQSLGSFSTLFRQRTGVSPSAFRKR